jgi:hypothetical protein
VRPRRFALDDDKQHLLGLYEATGDPDTFVQARRLYEQALNMAEDPCPRRPDRRDAAQMGEGGLAVQPVGIVTGAPCCSSRSLDACGDETCSSSPPTTM